MAYMSLGVWMMNEFTKEELDELLVISDICGHIYLYKKSNPLSTTFANMKPIKAELVDYLNILAKNVGNCLILKRIICLFKGHQWGHIFVDGTHAYVAFGCIKCKKEVFKVKVFND